MNQRIETSNLAAPDAADESHQRWRDAENGHPVYQSPYNDLRGGEAQFLVEYADYYRTPRGYHARSVNFGNAWMTSGSIRAAKHRRFTLGKHPKPQPHTTEHYHD